MTMTCTKCLDPDTMTLPLGENGEELCPKCSDHSPEQVLSCIQGMTNADVITKTLETVAFFEKLQELLPVCNRCGKKGVARDDVLPVDIGNKPLCIDCFETVSGDEGIEIALNFIKYTLLPSGWR